MADTKDVDEKLVSVLRREEQEAQSWQDSDLTALREKAGKYYDREKYGDEQPGESSVVTSEFADTVEGTMPSMMRVFAGSETVVEFTPDSREDEQAAKEANEYVPHVIMRQNDGFRLHYWFVKDALMYRMSGGCVDIEETERTKTETVPLMPAEAWAISRLELEAKSHAAKATLEYDLVEEDGMVSGTVTARRKVKKVVLDNIAPEDLLFSPNCRDIDEASFVGYRKRVTASDLRVLGVDDDRIKQLDSDRTYSVEQTQRQPDVVQNTNAARDGGNDSEKQFWVVVAYVKFDKNDDGISEMLRVVYAHAGGNSAEVIEEAEWTDGEAPIFVGSPILMSHTVPGRSLFDQVQDLQDISTALTRGLLNNVYMTNRPRPVVTDKVNLMDVVDWTPGQPIRLIQGATQVEGHVEWLEVPSIIGPTLTALQHVDSVKEKRTGQNAYNQGLDSDSLNKTATGMTMLTSASEQRIELIARTLAETAIKRAYRLTYRAIKRAASGPIDYYAGKDIWRQCDPTKWPDDMTMTVDLGPGTSSRQMQVQNLMVMGQAQEKLVASQGGATDGPLVNKKQIANTARKLAEVMGFKNTSAFVADDQEIERSLSENPPQPEPNPELIKAQMQAEAQRAKQEQDFVLAQQKQAQDLQLQRERNAFDLQAMREKANLEMQLRRETAALDYELKTKELGLEAALEKYKVDTQPREPAGGLQEQQVSQ